MPVRRPAPPLAVSPEQLRSLAQRLLVSFSADKSLTGLERLGVRKAASKLRDWAERDEDLLASAQMRLADTAPDRRIA